MPTRTASAEELLARFRSAADRAAEEQRAIQAKVDRKDQEAARKQKKDSEEKKRGVQAGTRTQPGTPVPPQHLRKPGLESELEPRPRFAAPDYKGSEKLKGMVAIVTGGDSGIGRAVAVLFA